ncbi:hypothetical protein V2G26_008927 [Clonostachys chloroleuca]|uniref:UspA domain-containing protein n=1 Tax=Clonostachys chloroleuca TaxID=1926264 RepID=A0AA35MJL5_9HYPO|nr:unnamed protein product [Clonostachys chloroleuca]
MYPYQRSSSRGSARSAAPTPMGDRPMSIDAMLDMERQEVLALLENKPKEAPPPEQERRTASPYATGRSPVRSMLDIEEEGPGEIKTSPTTQPPVRSMLDLDTPLPSIVKKTSAESSKLPISTPSSPTGSAFKIRSASQSSHHRSMSDAGYKPADFGPRATNRADITADYQFSGIYNNLGGNQLPLRASQKKKKSSSSSSKKAIPSSLGEALKGADLSGLQFPNERGRNNSLGGLPSRLGNQSKSPHNRLGSRSRSPATFGPQLVPGKAYLADGGVVDINSAYRRLSDVHLLNSSGTLAQLPMRKRNDEVGEGRLVKDYLGPDGEHLGSSDEEDAYSTDDEDRGRKKTPRTLNPDAKGEGDGDGAKGERPTLSLLAAAEEERKDIASQQPYQYRSLIPEPEIKITNTSGTTVKSKNAVHPNTSYDRHPNSATPSVIDSDEEADYDDIKTAQNLSFTMTNIQNTAHRAIRIIYRGEYQKIAQLAEEEHHRLRKYLVATDLSDESAHALEWAIGTVLRDGDTLIAIYCVDEETGIYAGEGALIPDEPKAMKEQAAAINTLANTKVSAIGTQVSELKRQSVLSSRRGESTGTPGASPAPSGRGEWNRAEEERNRAVQDITDRLLRLLRKTQLQVRVVVEVLHCKNPKHLITEVIDLVEPTLVVIGSRGRSALKGVILGSFSNYLVTKSSVPVMVARKRLRKQSKYKTKAVRQVNNLSNPAARSLANAKID